MRPVLIFGLLFALVARVGASSLERLVWVVDGVTREALVYVPAQIPAGGAPLDEVGGPRWPPEGSTGPVASGPVTATLEPGYDRPGYDLRVIDGLAAPEQCRQACLDDNLCHAFTWVQAGVQGDQTRCWIKTDVPPQREDACCTSGVVDGRPFDPH